MGATGAAGPAGATRILVTGLTTSSAPERTGSFYLGPFLTSSATRTESNVQQVMPVAGTVSNLAVRLGTAPGFGANSWAFTVRKNGVSTGVTCQVEGPSATSCSDNADSVTFAAGDLLSLEAAATSNPSGWGSLRWALTLTE